MFGRVETKKKDALWRVAFWDDLEKERELGLEEIEEQTKAKEELRVGLSWRRFPGDKNLERSG